MRLVRPTVLLLVGIFISACATVPEIPYDRMVAGEIKSVAIVTLSMSDDASVVLASSVGQSFGLVGALVDASLQASRENHFKTILADHHFSARDAFLGQLKKDLESNGYSVSDIDLTRSGTKFFAKYPADAHVDAFLDIVITNYGYISAGIGKDTPYRPELALQVRLVRAKDSSVLMQDSIVYNPYGPYKSQKTVTISPTPTYSFPTFDELEARPDLAVEGLKDAADQSADAIGNLMR